MKIDRKLLRASWASWIAADMARAGPYWLQLVWTALFAAVLALFFTIVGSVSYAEQLGAWLSPARWARWYGINLAVTALIAYLIHGLFEFVGWLIGGPPRIRRFTMPQRLAFFGGIPILGVIIGWPLGMWLVAGKLSVLRGPEGLRLIATSAALCLLISAVLYQWFGAKARAIDAERRAAESQLKLLQAQMEPHFLFNTLANVQALIDHDPGKAKAMLGAFTDYLRASLGELRRDEVTLADELALAEAYLRVQAARMEERLAYRIEADASLQGAALLPLTLQPLVENAVHHGLEPKVEGGLVEVRARAEGSSLVVEVRDNGRGLDAAPRARGAGSAGGAGVALANLRERLARRYGDAASVTLVAAGPGSAGAVATLRLPRTVAAATEARR
ncbi:MAG: histidine kinase [Rubrivivax sp.]|nr:histidine kinase [Rubrivivax sp.]